MPPARKRGSITIEIIIAFAVLSLTLSAVFVLICGNDAATLERRLDELSLAKSALKDERAPDVDYFDIVSASSTAILNGREYEIETAVHDESPCLKSVSVRAFLRNPKAFEELGDGVEFSTVIANTDEALALGADCDAELTNNSWQYPTPFAEESLPGASGTAIDVLGGIAYIGLSAPPYFAIADTRDVHAGQMQGLILAFENHFALYAKPYALDAIWLGHERYVFAALDATSSQLAVLRVTDAAHPVLVATSTLRGVDPLRSQPEGYLIKYYGGDAYVLTQETAGPELHVFDCSNPESPRELGNGTEINRTINDVVVRDEQHDGVRHRMLYGASTVASGELSVYDVTNPNAIFRSAVVDLPETGSTHHRGRSIALAGRSIYLGRTYAESGTEFFKYDFNVSNVLVPSASFEISGTVNAITLAGSFAYLNTTNDTKRLQIWNIEDPAHAGPIGWYSASGIAPRGLDYENNRLYATGSTTLQIVESI